MIFAEATTGKVLTFQNPDGWFDIVGGGDVQLGEGGSFHVSPFAAAHRIFTNSMGALPIKLYRKTEGGRESVPDHHTDYVLRVRTNERMSPFVAFKLLASQCFLYGVAYALPVCDPMGHLLELLPLPTKCVSPWKDDRGNRWYVVTIDAEQRKFIEGQIVKLFWETTDGDSGKGVLDIAREAIELDRMGQRYANRFYKNGARPSGLIEVASSLEKEKRDKVRESFERAVSGMDNAFRVAVIDSGMKFTQMGMSQVDAQFIESRQFSIEEIARFTGIPLYKLQSGKQSYESNEQQGIEYVTDVLRPTAIQWEQELTYKLLIPEERRSMYYRFNLAAEMRGDDKARSEYYERMVRNAIYSPNECRALEEENGYPNGEKYYMTKNYAPIETLGKEGGNG